MKLRFAPRATRDLADIAEYIRQHNPAAAQRIRGAILATLENLTRFPEMGHRQATPGVWKIVVRRYAYLVYYSLDPSSQTVVIIAIQHAARNRLYSDA